MRSILAGAHQSALTYRMDGGRLLDANRRSLSDFDRSSSSSSFIFLPSSACECVLSTARVLLCPPEPEPGLLTVSPRCIPICGRHRNYECSSWRVPGCGAEWSCALPPSLCLLSVTAPSARLSPRCGTGLHGHKDRKTEKEEGGEKIKKERENSVGLVAWSNLCGSWWGN